MASDTNINSILTQGNAIKSIYNVKKQNLELQQQFAAQHTEVKNKEDKVKVQKFGTDNKVEIKDDSERKKKQREEKLKKKMKTEAKDKKELNPEGTLIDIKV
jgi:hypothetical protein